jgi:hypothetical protein
MNAMDDEQVVAALMAQIASAPLPAAHLPEADALWWQAQLRRAAEGRRRAERPIEVMEWVQLGAAAAIAVAAFVWALPSLEAVIRLVRI